MTMFIDAIDEAGSKTARELASYFHKLNDRVANIKGNVRICISCRHYPIVATSSSLEVRVEDENQRDILNYVHNKLNSEITKEISDSEAKDDWLALEEEMVKKSPGLFQWAKLVIHMILGYHQEGESLAYIRQRLRDVPEELGSVYEHILKNLEPRKQRRTLHMMQWVCLAERPLSVIELRLALASDDSYYHKQQGFVEDFGDLAEIDERRKKPITNLSGGLVEVQRHEDRSTVQFIHQSVKDFMLENGLRYLASVQRDAEPSADGAIIGRSQDRLSRSCINYLGSKEVLLADTITNEDLLREKLAFIDYATRSWLLHAEKAEGLGTKQQHLIQKFGSSSGKAFENWVTIYKVLDEWDSRRPAQHSTLLHIAAGSNLASIISALLENGAQIEEQDTKGNRAIHFAARWSHKDLVEMLLEAHAEIGAKNKNGNTPLERAAANGHEGVIRLLLDQGGDINEGTGDSGNALQAAALDGSLIVVRMLVEHGADVNAQGGEYGNALQAASHIGNKEIVQLLLEKGADVNAQGGVYDNVLQAASRSGNKEIVQLLLEKGADVNAQGGAYGNALQAASCSGNKEIVQLVLEKGADVNTQGGVYDNALQAASLNGNKEIAQLLLEKGADVNAQGGYLGNALQAASCNENKKIVQLFA